MNLPPLTAEASLYQSHAYYRSNAHTGFLPSRARQLATVYPGDGTVGSETITVHGSPPVTVPGTEVITVHGTVPLGGGSNSKPPVNYGDGPNQNQLPQPPFQCEPVSVNISTCYSCFQTSTHGILCTCYDCERYTGKCTTGYDCTADYVNR
jgi:hypothetical protein